MMKISKKLRAALLALIMVLSMFPAVVSADEVPTDVINATSLTYGWGGNTTALTFYDVSGSANGLTYTGVYGTCNAGNYGSYIHFTSDAIAAIQAYAAENGYGTLRIGLRKTYRGGAATPSSGGNVYNTTTGSKVDVVANDGSNSYFKADWKYWDFSVDDLTEDFPRINMQAETGYNYQVNVTFEFIAAISTSYFVAQTGKSVSFTEYNDTIGGREISGIRATSSAYQPSFYFTSDAITAIQAYAAFSGVDTLQIRIYPVLYNNAFVVRDGSGTQLRYARNNAWTAVDIAISDLTTETRFLSQSEGVTNVYMTFEMYKAAVINAESFAYGWGGNTNKMDYYASALSTQTTNGLTYTGVYGQALANAGGVYTHFTSDAVTAIRAYAAANGYTTLRIGLSQTANDATGTSGGNVYDATNGKHDVPNLDADNSYYRAGWAYYDFAVSDLSTLYPMILLNNGTTKVEVNMTFAFRNIVDSWSISLGDAIGANFYQDLTAKEASRTTVTITVNDEETPVDLTLSNGLYKATAELAAAQMTDTIKVTIQKVSNLNAAAAHYYTTYEKEYTIRQYADVILSGDYPETTKTLVKTMLDYGGKAQTYFNYNTEDMANAGISVSNQALPDAPAIVKSGTLPSGVSYYGASLIFESKVVVRFYFNVTGDVNDYTFTAGGSAATPEARGGHYYVDVEDINPANLDQNVTATVSDGGNTYSVSYSPLRYMVRMSSKGAANLQALVQAMYNYHIAAKAYAAA